MPMTGPWDDDGGAEAAALRDHLFGGLTACSPQAEAVARSLLDLTGLARDRGSSGPDAGDQGLGTGAVLADDLVLLARAAHVLAAETGRRAVAAERVDATATGARSTLRAAGWTRSQASGLLEAAGLVADHPDLLPLWHSGQAPAGQLAVLATRTKSLTRQQRCAVVDVLTPLLPGLSPSTTRAAADAAVDALRPEDAKKREQFAHDRRYLVASVYADTVLVEARLPLLEGRAFLAAVEAHAEKLRSSSDRLTTAQRRADGLAQLVAAAAATPSAGGLPAAVTITVPLSEADRLTGHTDSHRLGGDDGRGTVGGDDGRGTVGADAASLLPIRPQARIGQTGTLGDAAGRFLMCCADLTGVVVHHSARSSPMSLLLGLAREEPLAVGRAQRLATTAQRKALAVRDRGCVIPGCQVPPQQCQPHHVTDWAAGGNTDLDSLALLCWSHHRQVDLGRWNLTRNPDPHGPHWTTSHTPRHTWRPRAA